METIKKTFRFEHSLLTTFIWLITFSVVWGLAAPQNVSAQGNTGGDTLLFELDSFYWGDDTLPGDIIWKIHFDCPSGQGWRNIFDFKYFPQDSQFVAKVDVSIQHNAPVGIFEFFRMHVGDSIFYGDEPIHINMNSPSPPPWEVLSVINETCSPVDSVEICTGDYTLDSLIVYTCCKPIAPDTQFVCLDTVLLDLDPLIHCDNGSFSGPGVDGDQFDPIDAGVGDHIIEYCDTCDVNNEICCVDFIIRVCEVEILEIECDTVCYGGADGMATVDAISDCMPLSFEWSNGETTQTIDSLVPGTYIVTVTDDNGCQAIDSCIVEECPELEIIEIVCDTICPDSTNGMAMVQVEGGCEPLEYSWSDGSSSNGPTVNSLPEGWVYVTITDANGCEAIDSCEIIGNDIEPPEAICEDITIYVDGDGEASIEPGDVDGGSEDNCGIDSMFVSRSEFDCHDINGSVNVTLTVIDIAGLVDSCTAEVTVMDTIPPPINCPDSVVLYSPEIGCIVEAAYDPPATSDSLDNCGEPIVITYNPPVGSPLIGAGTFATTAGAFDSNGNSSSCSFNIVVKDTVPPQIFGCPADVDTVLLSDWLTGPGINTQCFVIGPHAHPVGDNCGIQGLAVIRTPTLDDTLWAGTVEDIFIQVTDYSGNTATCNYDLYIIDDIDPQILCPDPITVYTPPDTCNAWVNLQVSTSDNCGVASVSNSYNSGGSDASDFYDPGTTTVFFTVWDVNGNSAGCATTVTVWDPFPPVVTCPADTTVVVPSGQTEAYIQLDSAEAWDNCGIANFFNDFNLGGPDASDTFSLGTTSIQFIALKNAVLGTPPPFADTCITNVTVADCAPIGLNANCTPVSCPESNDGTAVANISGGIPPINYEWSTGANTDSISGLVAGVYTVTVTDSDGCIEVDSCTVTAPPPLTITVDCDTICPGAGNGTATVAAVGGCPPYTYAWSNGNSTDTATGLSAGQVCVTVTDSDGSSVTACCDIIEMDDQAPVIRCPPDEMVNLPPGSSQVFVQLDSAEAVDNCPPVTIVNDYNTGGPDASDVYPVGTTFVEFTAIDPSGNASTCITVVEVSSTPLHTISGDIATEFGTPVNAVLMEVTDAAGNPVLTDTSNTAGEYSFSVPAGYSIVVTPCKDSNWLDGVTTLSLIMIQRHILQIDTLSPYGIIAADANWDDVVSTFDLVLLQSSILGAISFPSKSWRFVYADYVFQDPLNPLDENFTEARVYPNVTQDYSNEDWVGIKIGDVVGLTSGLRYPGGEFVLLSEVVANDDGSADVIFRSKHQHYITGYQFEFDLDLLQTSPAEIIWDHSLLPAIDHNNFFFDEEKGVLRANWWYSEDIEFERGVELFRIRMEFGESRIDWPGALQLLKEGSMWQSEVYAGNGTHILQPRLVWAMEETEERYALYQNRPNPFTRETVIPFKLPENMEVTLELSDVEGSLLKSLKIDGEKGVNEWVLRDQNLPSGVIFYRIIAEDWSASRKMIQVR